MNAELYYIQDARTMIGNCAVFWRRNNEGYTCNLAEAKVWTKAEIEKKGWRETDIPRRKTDVDALSSRHTDVHALHALAGPESQRPATPPTSHHIF